MRFSSFRYELCIFVINISSSTAYAHHEFYLSFASNISGHRSFVTQYYGRMHACHKETSILKLPLRYLPLSMWDHICLLLFIDRYIIFSYYVTIFIFSLLVLTEYHYIEIIFSFTRPPNHSFHWIKSININASRAIDDDRLWVKKASNLKTNDSIDTAEKSLFVID